MTDAVELLAREYFHLSSVLEGLDDNLLTIKGWGVTVSLALLGGAILRKNRTALLVSGLGGGLFWFLEALKGAYAVPYGNRVLLLERYFQQAIDQQAIDAPVPLQIYSYWYDTWTWWDFSYRLFHVQTIVPNGMLVVISLIVFFMVRDKPTWNEK